ncbi:hypothetical protein, partial [Actinokineospora enzanensis]|uniref:hypothetical protein n=1 Tax=Actinokineospora enzanensis TaxID=155975 RepID=UPI00047597D7
HLLVAGLAFGAVADVAFFLFPLAFGTVVGVAFVALVAHLLVALVAFGAGAGVAFLLLLAAFGSLELALALAFGFQVTSFDHVPSQRRQLDKRLGDVGGFSHLRARNWVRCVSESGHVLPLVVQRVQRRR